MNTSLDLKSGDSSASRAVQGLIFGLVIIFVVLRFYTRTITKAGLWWDDWLISVAVSASVLVAILIIWGRATNPLGKAVSENTDPRYAYRPNDVLFLKLSFVTSILYFIIVGSTKLSILCMYNRLFSVDAAFRRQLIISSVLVLCFWIGCTAAALTKCIPLKWSWINGLQDPRYCFNYNIFWVAAGVCEVFIDILILTLPIRAVCRLQLSRKRQVTVMCIFLLGGFVIVTGLVKAILGYDPGARLPSFSQTEVWTIVHAGMAIVCACLPILKPLVNRVSESKVIANLKALPMHPWSSSLRRWKIVNASKIMRNEKPDSGLECESVLGQGERALQHKQTASSAESIDMWLLRESGVETA